jgi:hypothetical protein
VELSVLYINSNPEINIAGFNFQTVGRTNGEDKCPTSIVTTNFGQRSLIRLLHGPYKSIQ